MGLVRVFNKLPFGDERIGFLNERVEFLKFRSNTVFLIFVVVVRIATSFLSDYKLIAFAVGVRKKKIDSRLSSPPPPPFMAGHGMKHWLFYFVVHIDTKVYSRGIVDNGDLGIQSEKLLLEPEN